MSSHRTTNRHPNKPPNTANIRAPDAPYGVIENDIPQPEYPDGARLHSRKRIPHQEATANLKAAASAHGVDFRPNLPQPSMTRDNAPPGDIARITRGDVELFFDASHAFRTSLAKVLPEIANRIGKFILAEPYTIIDPSGRPVQMIPDAAAMTATQVKLAGLILHRLLPPITDMDIEGRPGLGKGTHIDARQVKITVNTVTNADGAGDPTDARLRAGGPNHPNAARQISPITMNLGEVVEKAMAGGPDAPAGDPTVVRDTLPRDLPEKDTPDGAN
jgi:hypothetical protein